MHTHARTHTCTHTHTHAQTHLRAMPMEPKKRQKVFEEDLKELTETGLWFQVKLRHRAWNSGKTIHILRKKSLTTRLSWSELTEGWYSEHSGICRRTQLPGRGKMWMGA